GYERPRQIRRDEQRADQDQAGQEIVAQASANTRMQNWPRLRSHGRVVRIVGGHRGGIYILWFARQEYQVKLSHDCDGKTPLILPSRTWRGCAAGRRPCPSA